MNAETRALAEFDGKISHRLISEKITALQSVEKAYGSEKSRLAGVLLEMKYSQTTWKVFKKRWSDIKDVTQIEMLFEIPEFQTWRDSLNERGQHNKEFATLHLLQTPEVRKSHPSAISYFKKYCRPAGNRASELRNERLANCGTETRRRMAELEAMQEKTANTIDGLRRVLLNRRYSGTRFEEFVEKWNGLGYEERIELGYENPEVVKAVFKNLDYESLDEREHAFFEYGESDVTEYFREYCMQ